MIILAALVFTLSAVCADDVARWSPSLDADLDHYEVTIGGGSPILTALTAYPVACTAGTVAVCIRAVDRTGNRSLAACMDWAGGNVGPILDIGPCAVGCRGRTAAKIQANGCCPGMAALP